MGAGGARDTSAGLGTPGPGSLPLRGDRRCSRAGWTEGSGREKVPVFLLEVQGESEVVEKGPLSGPKSPPPACATPVGEVTNLPKPRLPFFLFFPCRLIDSLCSSSAANSLGREAPPLPSPLGPPCGSARPQIPLLSPSPRPSRPTRRRQVGGRRPVGPAAPEAKVRPWGRFSSPLLPSEQQGRRWPRPKGCDLPLWPRDPATGPRQSFKKRERKKVKVRQARIFNRGLYLRSPEVAARVPWRTKTLCLSSQSF